MRSLLKINAILQSILLVALSCFPLLPLRITGLLILIWGVSALLFFLEKQSYTKKKLLTFGTLILPYIILLISIAWSDDSKMREFALVQKISIWAFPLGFLAISQSLNKARAIMLSLCFAASVILVSLYGNLMILLEGFIPVDVNYLKSDWSVRYRLSIEYYTLIHPTYLALFQIFSVFSLVHLLNQKSLFERSKRTIQPLAIGSILILLAMLVLLGARFPVAVGILISTFYFLKSPIKPKQKILVLLFAVLGISMGLASSPTLRHRLAEINTTNFSTAPSGENHNSTNIRVGIYSCAISLIKENPILGVGVGDTQTELNQCYQKYNTSIYEVNDYNTHNSYLNFWVTAGVFGFASLVFLYGYLVRLTRKTPLFQSLILLIAFCSLTENFLDRQMGVVFIFFFLSLFAFTSLKTDHE